MFIDESRREQLQNIISGISISEPISTLFATRNYLCSSFATNTTIKKDFEYQQGIKEKQKLELISFAHSQDLLNDNFVDTDLCLTEGGEAEIYFSRDGTHVIKVNDRVGKGDTKHKY